MAPTMILLCYQHEYTVLRVHAPQPTVGFFLQVAPMIEDGNILIDEPPSTVSTISTTGLPIPMTQKHVMMARYSSSFRSFQVFLGLNTDLVGLFVCLLEDEIDHLSDLIGRHGCCCCLFR
mmetsp:Transcript_60325/g.148032  ORF Transcript_60325/g.148032 Transcript_60325/m.148032 type:complete len:120 (-) Transcript_60325:67-426(-)